MLIVDSSVLADVVTDSPRADLLRGRLAQDTTWAAPHLIDAEVLAVAQGHLRRGLIDHTAASLAVDDLRSRPGERWPHRVLVERAFELRDNIRSYDALYIALAEALDATLLTLDERLVSASAGRVLQGGTGPHRQLIHPSPRTTSTGPVSSSPPMTGHPVGYRSSPASSSRSFWES